LLVGTTGVVDAEAELARASGTMDRAAVAATAAARYVRRLMMRFRPGASSAKRPRAPSG
jgi:hypothetical protein